ncbi:MAG: AmmeMemoRadiSam system protein A [Anaerolineae bacterium]|nr:AmmeMemoRadiSam system protein A [Anaerolineae bacterium]
MSDSDESGTTYSAEEQGILLGIARQTLNAVTAGERRPTLDLNMLPSHIVEQRACFVTLRRDHQLRGCTGTVIARQPLAIEVSVSTERTALDDPRFHPVTAEEAPLLLIELSVLSVPMPLDYERTEDLPQLLRPGIDGVLLQYGTQRATYLPQVWESIPDPENFLTMLTRKMGQAGELWRMVKLNVYTYQSFSFEETR